MIELGVTLDAIANLRESRSAKTPDPIFAAFLAEQAGASAINVQLRGDGAHVQERDVNLLRETVTIELNLVVTPRQEMARFTLTAKPDRVTFIPERLETAGGGGLDVMLNSSQLKERIREMRESSILPAIYLDPSIDQVKAAHQVGALGVELSAESYVAASERIAIGTRQRGRRTRVATPVRLHAPRRQARTSRECEPWPFAEDRPGRARSRWCRAHQRRPRPRRPSGDGRRRACRGRMDGIAREPWTRRELTT